MKPFDLPETLGAGNNHDILPYFVSLQDFHGDTGKLSNQVPMLEYLPHVNNVLVYIWYVNCGLSVSSA